MTLGWTSAPLPLPGTGLPLLREIIHERTGLFFDDAHTDLMAERLAPLVLERGFRSFLDLYYLLRYDEAAAATVWRRVLDALSVQETYFWREIDQIRAVVDHVVPIIAAQGEVVRIWCGLCATGEEPLTIAMALNEAGWFDRARIEIAATDGSERAIEKARAARYSGRAFRALPEALKQKYFTQVDSAWTPIPSLRARIGTWQVANLMSREDIAPFATSSIVFCRNGFIYFSPQSIKRVVEMLAAAMPAQGYLCIGASESLLSVTTAFTLEDIGGAFMYLKRSWNE